MGFAQCGIREDGDCFGSGSREEAIEVTFLFLAGMDAVIGDSGSICRGWSISLEYEMLIPCTKDSRVCQDANRVWCWCTRQITNGVCLLFERGRKFF